MPDKAARSCRREERIEQAGEILGSTNAYHLRYQMLIIAPAQLGDAADQAFMRVRDLRDRFDGPDISADSLRRAMRADLTTG